MHSDRTRCVLSFLYIVFIALRQCAARVTGDAIIIVGYFSFTAAAVAAAMYYVFFFPFTSVGSQTMR